MGRSARASVEFVQGVFMIVMTLEIPRAKVMLFNKEKSFLDTYCFNAYNVREKSMQEEMRNIYGKFRSQTIKVLGYISKGIC